MKAAALLLLFSFALPLLAQERDQKAALATLDNLRDRYRPVIIFGSIKEPNAHPTPLEQLWLLDERRDDLINRQVMLVVFPGPGTGVFDTETMLFPMREEPSLRRRFNIHPNEFTVVLLGKDGGEKFRSHALITNEQLNKVIDAMPMRQQELRDRNQH